MQRFRLQRRTSQPGTQKFETCTFLDGEVISEDHVRIIYNACQQNRSLEDAAFNNEKFSSGKVVTFYQIERQLKVFVRLANGKLNNLSWRGMRVTYNPVTHKVKVRVPRKLAKAS